MSNCKYMERDGFRWPPRCTKLNVEYDPKLCRKCMFREAKEVAGGDREAVAANQVPPLRG